MSTESKIAYYNEMGISYEEAYGKNAEQINYVSRSLDLIAKHSTTQSTVSVLDIGCGTGKPTAPLVTARGYKFHGIDFSSVMIDIARKQVPEGTFECLSLLDFETPESPYDAAFAIFALFAITREEMEQLASRWGEWVKPGGFLFIGTMDVDAFPQGTEFVEREGDSVRARHRVVGHDRTLLVWTKTGWEKLLQKGGFELVSSELKPFHPLADSGGMWEPHLYLTCRKVAET